MNTKVLLLTFCCSLGLMVLPCRTMAEIERDNERAGVEIAANEDRGGEIIRAIESYAHDHARFPEQLDDLMPGYLAVMPETVAHQSFSYRQDDIDGYHLCFGLDSKPNVNCCYINRLAFWDCSVAVSH